MLQETHLINNMKMKLGSVLKFKAAMAAKVGSCPICLHCIHCHSSTIEPQDEDAAKAEESHEMREESKN